MNGSIAATATAPAMAAYLNVPFIDIVILRNRSAPMSVLIDVGSLRDPRLYVLSLSTTPEQADQWILYNKHTPLANHPHHVTFAWD
jgi:hypothetical protein